MILKLVILSINILYIACQHAGLREELKESGNFDEAGIEQYENLLTALRRLGKFQLKGQIDRRDLPPQRLAVVDNELQEMSVGIFEGDILLTKEQMDQVIRSAHSVEGQSFSDAHPLLDIQRRVKRKLTTNSRSFWGKNINYSTQRGVDTAAVRRGINLWESLTCLSFSNRASGDYMLFIQGSGCYSNIGRSGGQQTISIGRGCESVGIVAHEIGHALGFWHEQSRPDRDNFIRIISGNIQSGTEGNFLKRSSREINTKFPFDLGSVMHYGPQAFTRTRGRNTIETRDGNYANTIGQRVGLSFYDVRYVNEAYCEDVCPRSLLRCQHNGYPDPKDCSVCRCPDGFAGDLCERAARTSSSCGTIDLTATATLQTIRKSSASGRCNWHIKAPAGKRILMTVSTFSFRSATTCTSAYLELKYGDDMANTGARMCTSRPSSSILSEGNEAMVIFLGNRDSFTLSFRFDPPTPVATTPSPTTTTTTTRRPTTTTTDGTGTTAATTTTTRRPTTTTTTTRRPTTTTRRPTTTTRRPTTTTRRPTTRRPTRRPWWLTTRRPRPRPPPTRRPSWWYFYYYYDDPSAANLNNDYGE